MSARFITFCLGIGFLYGVRTGNTAGWLLALVVGIWWVVRPIEG